MSHADLPTPPTPRPARPTWPTWYHHPFFYLRNFGNETSQADTSQAEPSQAASHLRLTETEFLKSLIPESTRPPRPTTTRQCVVAVPPPFFYLRFFFNEPRRAKPRRAEPSRAEPSRAESGCLSPETGTEFFEKLDTKADSAFPTDLLDRPHRPTTTCQCVAAVPPPFFFI